MTALRVLAVFLLLGGCCLPGCASVFHRQPAGEDETPLSAAQKHHDRGVAFAKHGKPERAEVAFQEAIIADKDFGPAHNNLGRLQFDRRDLHAAAWSFQRAIELMPGRAEPPNNLGLTYEAAGRFDQAIEMYLQAVSLAPDNPECLGNLIRARLKAGEAQESLEFDLERLVGIDTRADWIEWAELKLVMVRRQKPAGQDDTEELDTPTPERNPAAEQMSGPAEALPPPAYQGDLPVPQQTAPQEPTLASPELVAP